MSAADGESHYISHHEKILENISNTLNIMSNEIRLHSGRLSKIEDAIVQLAATQERVRGLENLVNSNQKILLEFQKDVWLEFKAIREKQSESVESRAKLDLSIQHNAMNIQKNSHDIAILENMREDISANTKIRKWLEKGVYAIIITLLLSVVGSYIAINSPKNTEKRLAKIEQILEAHSRTQIEEQKKKQQNTLNNYDGLF